MSTAEGLGRVAGRLARRYMPAARQAASKAASSVDAAQIGRMAGRAAKHWTPTSEQTGQFAKKSGLFVKHVVPAAVKPVHSLWHQILGFLFMFFAFGGVMWIWRHRDSPDPVRFGFVIFIIVVMAGYGLSSIRKSRRISRS